MDKQVTEKIQKMATELVTACSKEKLPVSLGIEFRHTDVEADENTISDLFLGTNGSLSDMSQILATIMFETTKKIQGKVSNTHEQVINATVDVTLSYLQLLIDDENKQLALLDQPQGEA